MIKSYRDLKVWQDGIELAVAVYQATENYPKSEMFGLQSQMRRAAGSVSANIAEGFSRQHNTEFIQFLYIARGSLSELDTFLYLSRRLGFLDEVTRHTLQERLDEVGKMLHGLIATVRRNSNAKPAKRAEH